MWTLALAAEARPEVLDNSTLNLIGVLFVALFMKIAYDVLLSFPWFQRFAHLRAELLGAFAGIFFLVLWASINRDPSHLGRYLGAALSSLGGERLMHRGGETVSEMTGEIRMRRRKRDG